MDQNVVHDGRRMGMKFVFNTKTGEKKVFVLDQATPKAIIGRNPNCEMITDCLAVSRYHAFLVLEDGHVYVSFLASGAATNGLSVDGKILRENERLEIFEGSRLSVGDFLAVAYPVNATVYVAGGSVPSLNEGLVFFWRFGKEYIGSFWINSQNRLAVIGSKYGCDICIPECMEKVSPLHAILLWLPDMDRDRVYIERHPCCSWQEIILDIGSMYEKKIVNGLYGLYSECLLRIGNVDIFAFYPDHAFKLLEVQATMSQMKYDSAQRIDKIMAEAYAQIWKKNELQRNSTCIMVGYGPPPA